VSTSADRSTLSAFQRFLKWEAAGGLTLIVAAAVAILWVNSPLSRVYDAILDAPVSVQLPAFALANAGVSLAGLSLASLMAPGPLASRWGSSWANKPP